MCRNFAFLYKRVDKYEYLPPYGAADDIYLLVVDDLSAGWSNNEKATGKPTH